jgi:hypothetical protein
MSKIEDGNKKNNSAQQGEHHIQNIRVKCFNWPIVISIIAIVVSILAICTSLSSFSLSETAYLGWTVSVLSTLVVILMGRQIYEIVHLNQYKTEIEKRIRETEREIKSSIDNSIQEIKLSINPSIDEVIKCYNHVVLAHIYQLYGIVRMESNDLCDTLHLFMAAIDEVNQATHKELVGGGYTIACEGISVKTQTGY